LNALVAPARILGGQADDESLRAGVQRRASWTAMRVGPRAGDQPPVPAQQRLRSDEKAGPAGSESTPASWQEAGVLTRRRAISVPFRARRHRSATDTPDRLTLAPSVASRLVVSLAREVARGRPSRAQNRRCFGSNESSTAMTDVGRMSVGELVGKVTFQGAELTGCTVTSTVRRTQGVQSSGDVPATTRSDRQSYTVTTAPLRLTTSGAFSPSRLVGWVARVLALVPMARILGWPEACSMVWPTSPGAMACSRWCRGPGHSGRSQATPCGSCSAPARPA
jgi:hypothetical protein